MTKEQRKAIKRICNDFDFENIGIAGIFPR